MNKKDSSMLLFERIGEIDESILHECSDYYPVVRRKKRSLRAAIIAAAALTTLFSVVLVGSFAVLLRRSFSGNTSPGEYEEPGQSFDEPKEEPSAEFAGNWEELTEEETHDRIFGETPAIVCKKRGEDTYRCASLTNSQYDGIVNENPRDALPDEQTEWQIWVTDGKGMVFTPYLRACPGNIHYGRLFDYNEEVEPGGYFQNVLYALGA